MDYSLISVLTILASVLNSVSMQPPPPPGKECIVQHSTSGACMCKMTDDSSIVDITSLGVPNAPKFKDVKGSDGYMYSYDPCNSFSEGACQDSAMCKSSGEVQQNIGQADQIEFQYDEESKNVLVAYIARVGTRLAISEVELICDTTACEPTFEAIGVQQEYLYKFKMTTVCACTNMCTSSGPISCNSGSGGSFGGGTIVLIIATVVLVLYVTSGVLYQKIRKNATGGDLIPNKEFWKSFPGLVKSGFFFTFSKCFPNRAKYQSAN